MLTDIDMEQAKHLVEGIDIPVRPAALQTIMEEQIAEIPDLRNVANAISSDVSLAAGVIKTINSPLYGLRTKISSIPQAVNLLGFKNTVNIATSISLRLALKGAHNIAVERFWDSASDVALICASLSRTLSLSEPDEAYAAGLFHDCGIPLLMLKDDGYVDLLKLANCEHDRIITEVEDEYINTNHTVVGYYTAKSWRVPENICMAILNHHERDLLALPVTEQVDLIAVLKMAEAISHAIRRLSVNNEWDRIQYDILNYVNLTESEFFELREDMVETLQAA